MGFYGSQAENMADYVSKRVSQIRSPIGSGQVRVDLSDGRSYVIESAQISKEMKMVTYMDVTILVSAIKEAETANRAKADFLTSMSHELRTPFNGMLGFAQMLDLGLSGPLNEKQADYVRQIEKGGKHLVDLIVGTPISCNSLTQ
jgi:signal transduction histidine kinase